MIPPKSHPKKQFGLLVRLWPGVVARNPLGADVFGAAPAFTASVRVTAATTMDAAAAGLALVAESLGHRLTPSGPSKPNGGHDLAAGAEAALIDASATGGSVSLWRAQDGWLLVSTAQHDAWRTFAGAFLNQTVYRSVAAADAWRDTEVNALATTVLDTHTVDGAALTCLTYGVPAAAVRGWRDREIRDTPRRLADQLAWAALIELE